MKYKGKNNDKKWMELFTDCLIKLYDNNVKIILSKTDRVYLPAEQISCSGWFDSAGKNGPTLACAVYGPAHEWIPTFAHEYCHFIQWKKNIKIWQKCDKITQEKFNKVLSDKPLTNDLNKVLDDTRDLEVDCEKRTIKLIKKYNIDFDYEKYIAEANTYIHFYNYMKMYRSWYPTGQPPYKNEKLLDLAPKHMAASYRRIPKPLLGGFMEIYPISGK